MALNLEYTYLNTGKLSVYNGEGVAVEVILLKYDDDSSTTEVVTSSIDADSTLEFDLLGDGVYKIYPTSATDEIHLFVSDYTIKENLNTITTNILTDTGNLNKLNYYTSYNLLIMAFYSKIESHFAITTVFDTINAETLDILVEFMDIISKIQEYEVILLNTCNNADICCN